MEKNKNIESITGDPKSAINKLAFPLVASLLLVMSNNLIDSIWVSGLGAAPLAALGFVTPLIIYDTCRCRERYWWRYQLTSC